MNDNPHQPVPALPSVVDRESWQRALDELRQREKAATRELDAIAAQRRRLPMVELPDYTLDGPDGPIRLVEVFDGRSQLIVYNHMWSDGAEWQCGGCTSFTSQFTRLDFLANYDARFVIVTNGPINDALAYQTKVGNAMSWYSSQHSSFASDVDAPPGGGFAVNVFLRDGDIVYRTWHTNGRGTEQLSHTFALLDILPWGRQEEWQDSPPGWPKSPTYSGWLDSPDIAHLYGPPRTEPVLADLNETTTAVIHGVVPMTEIADFFDRSFSELAAVLDRQGIAPTGPAYARYAGPPGETADLEVGFPVHDSVAPEGQVHPSSLPAGRVARLVHAGSYDQLGETWGRLGAWIAGQGLTPGADLWEVYVTEPSPDMDPADLRTELFWAVQ